MAPPLLVQAMVAGKLISAARTRWRRQARLNNGSANTSHAHSSSASSNNGSCACCSGLLKSHAIVVETKISQQKIIDGLKQQLRSKEQLHFQELERVLGEVASRDKAFEEMAQAKAEAEARAQQSAAEASQLKKDYAQLVAENFQLEAESFFAQEMATSAKNEQLAAMRAAFAAQEAKHKQQLQAAVAEATILGRAHGASIGRAALEVAERTYNQKLQSMAEEVSGLRAQLEVEQLRSRRRSPSVHQAPRSLFGESLKAAVAERLGGGDKGAAGAARNKSDDCRASDRLARDSSGSSGSSGSSNVSSRRTSSSSSYVSCSMEPCLGCESDYW